MRLPDAIRRPVIAWAIRRVLRRGGREAVYERQQERWELELEDRMREHFEKMNEQILEQALRQSIMGGSSWWRQPLGEQASVLHAAPKAAPKAEPGRQAVKTGWARPFPPRAQSALWEDLHQFGGRRPHRDPHMGLHGGDPAVSFRCPACDLLQTPFGEIDRSCPYCGIRLHRSGASIFWWREPLDVKPWEPGQ